MVAVIGNAASVVSDGAKRIARETTDNCMSEEYDWFAKVIKNMGVGLNNHQFFTRIAMRPEAEGLLRWCLYVVKGSPDLDWVCAEARKVYEAPTSGQPHLLKIVEEFE